MYIHVQLHVCKNLLSSALHITPHYFKPCASLQSGSAGDEGKEETRDAGDETAGAGSEDSALVSSEVMAFQTNCSHCQSPTETRMKTVGIL